MLKHYPAAIEFVNTFNLDYCMEKYINIKTIEDALKSGKVKIRELTPIYTEKAIVSWIQAWLINLSSYMNFSITEQQAKTTAMFILEDCYMFNLAEFTLLFRKINRGNYGQFYGQFNGQIIMAACKEYRNQRGKILSGLTEQEQNEL